MKCDIPSITYTQTKHIVQLTVYDISNVIYLGTMHTHTYICTHTHANANRHAHAHACVHTHTHTYRHIHTERQT